ncbi:hypothetical protein CS063_07835 [Sporanaerobium hydrogeniformans]|uniref:Uncharacterized protein n=1 Tax=Sporanaerobium hydrogeniformans TaxID=3072179 RepID=A0AC61DED8_9FIRM|nr:hypothetical protein [Sporanaerobium hydrogeniformans]PHV70922.1 hypothetical protein CS063_07835 [Sporanaerobium hydrogeniformans]
MKVIVYYSKDGNVKKAAEDYAKEEVCDLIEIQDLVKRKGILGFIKSGYQAVRKLETPIAPIEKDLSQYDHVVLCMPVWAGTLATPMRTFLKQYGKQLKQVEYILMKGDAKNPYTQVMDEMDTLLGKRRVRGISLVKPH